MIKRNGFTLIEVLLAIFLLAMIGALISQALAGFVRTQNSIRTASNATTGIETTLLLFESDTSNMVARVANIDEQQVQAFYADPLNPLVDHELARFSVLNVDPIKPDHTRVSRVAWGLEDGRIYRDFWPYADRSSKSKPNRAYLLDAVKSVEIKIWLKDMGSVDEAVNFHGTSAVQAKSVDMPQALDIIIELEDGRRFRRLIASAPRLGTYVQVRTTP